MDIENAKKIAAGLSATDTSAGLFAHALRFDAMSREGDKSESMAALAVKQSDKKLEAAAALETLGR